MTHAAVSGVFYNAILETRKFSAILLQKFAVIWSIVMHVFRIWYDIFRTSKDLFIYSSLLCYWNTFNVSLCLLMIFNLQDSQLQITHSSSPCPLKYKGFNSALHYIAIFANVTRKHTDISIEVTSYTKLALDKLIWRGASEERWVLLL